MSEASRQALSGLKAAKDIVVQKAMVAKLAHQLRRLRRTIGKAAYEQSIDCGEASQKAAVALAEVQNADQKAIKTAEAMKKAAGGRSKALAAKEVAANKATRTAAEMRLNSAYDAVGAFVLAHGIGVPSIEHEIAQAGDLHHQIDALNQQIGQLGSGLVKNKIGLTALTCVVLLAGGMGWYVVGTRDHNVPSAFPTENAESFGAATTPQNPGTYGEKLEREKRQELPGILQKCLALADTDPDGAAELLRLQLVSLSDEMAVAEAMAEMPKDDQKKLAEVKRRAKELRRQQAEEARADHERFEAEGGWRKLDGKRWQAGGPAAEASRESDNETLTPQQRQIMRQVDALAEQFRALEPGPNATPEEQMLAARKQARLGDQMRRIAEQDPVFRKNLERQAAELQRMMDRGQEKR